MIALISYVAGHVNAVNKIINIFAIITDIIIKVSFYTYIFTLLFTFIQALSTFIYYEEIEWVNCCCVQCQFLLTLKEWLKKMCNEKMTQVFYGRDKTSWSRYLGCRLAEISNALCLSLILVKSILPDAFSSTDADPFKVRLRGSPTAGQTHRHASSSQHSLQLVFFCFSVLDLHIP